jgi:hypothetical protein
VLVGIESPGYSGWLERLLETLGRQVWVGDARQIRAAMTGTQKSDKRDAEPMVKLLLEGVFHGFGCRGQRTVLCGGSLPPSTAWLGDRRSNQGPTSPAKGTGRPE